MSKKAVEGNLHGFFAFGIGGIGSPREGEPLPYGVAVG